MTTPAGVRVADTLAVMLLRGFRESIYARIGQSSQVPIRDGTYPVLLGLIPEPATATHLSEKIGVDRSVVSRQAAALATLGLIDRTTDPADRRGGHLTLTDTGRQVAVDLRERFIEEVQTAMASWPVSEQDLFARRLAEIGERLSSPQP